MEPGVREREESVRHRAAVRARIPGLQQRAGRREQKVRQADGGGEQSEDPQQRVFAARAASTRRKAGWAARESSATSSARWIDGLARGRSAVEPVRIGVAAEQRHLEEEHATGPDRGRSAEPRQNQLGNERLHLKQQKRAEQNGGREEQRAGRAARYL